MDMLAVIDVPDKITVSFALLVSAAGTVATTVYYISKLLNKIEDRLHSIEGKIQTLEESSVKQKDVQIWTYKLAIKNPSLHIPEFGETARIKPGNSSTDE